MVKNKFKILVADEITVNRNLLSDMLLDEYEILQAQDGLEIIHMLEEHRNSLALILMNYVMPKKNGDEVLQKMQNMNLINIVPVIVIVDLNNAQGGVRALELGAADVMYKPIEPSLLRKRIQNVLEAHEYFCLSPELKQRHNSGAEMLRREVLKLTDKLEYYEKENECLKNLSKLDLLTKVYNKDCTYELVESYLQKEEKETYGFMLVEFSNIEKISERYSTEKGHKILKLFSEILKSHFNKNALIGRIDHACFLVFLWDFGEIGYLRKKAQSIMINIKNAEAELEGNDRIIVSIGVAVSPEKGRTYEELLSSAQKMINAGKKNGNCIARRNSFFMIEDDIIQEMVRGNAFFDKVQKLVNSYPNKNYLFIRIDISEFKKFAELNGYVEGEKLLNLVTDELNRFVGDKGVAGQIYTDTFGVCAEVEMEVIKKFLNRLEVKLFRMDTDIDLAPYCGIYKREDASVSITEMCNYAGLACQKAKQNKSKQIVVYHS